MNTTENRPTRPCQRCGRPVPKPVRGPWGRFCPPEPGRTPCRVAWHNERKRQERLNAREARSCVREECGEAIPTEANGNRRYCSRSCARIVEYEAIKRDPERLERHRERARRSVAQRRARAKPLFGGKCVACGASESLELGPYTAWRTTIGGTSAQAS